MIIILLPTSIEQYSHAICHFNEVKVQSLNSKPILVLVGTKLQKLKSIVKKLSLVLVLKFKTNCAIFMSIVKVLVLAWYLS
jgi:hypothetical protein